MEGRCSIQNISSILKESGDWPNSVGFISEFLQDYSSALPSTLSLETPKFVFYLSDEIFSINAPLLVTIDVQSTAILKIELASNRSAETWRKHFLDLKDHLFVTLGMASDRGLGLVKGYEAACETVLWVCDYFHELRDLFKLVDQLEAKAYALITDQEEAFKKFNNAKSEVHLGKRLGKYEGVSQACEKAILVYDDLFFLTQSLREILQLCSSNGVLKSKIKVETQLEAVLLLIESLDHGAIQAIVKPLKKNSDDILVPFQQLDKIYEELLKVVDKNTLEILTLAWHHDHFSHQTKGGEKRYHHNERNFWFDVAEAHLGKDFQKIQTLTFEKIDSVIRSSSLVEMINSIIRPYLNNSKGQINQEFLNLIMFYHNHRKYKSGRRKGMAPIELLNGKKLKVHWTEVLIHQVKNKERNVIPFPKENLKMKTTVFKEYDKDVQTIAA